MTNKLSISRLKELVSEPGNLDLVINYFFDMLDVNLLPSSSIKETSSPEVQALLNSVNEVINKHFKLKTKISKAMLEQTTDKQIIHGLCFLSSTEPLPLDPINIIYVRDLKIAIIFMYYNGKTEMWRLCLQDANQVTHH